MPAALVRRADVMAGDLRVALREKGIRHGGISRNGQTIELRASDAQTLEAARNLISDQFTDLVVEEIAEASGGRLRITLAPEAARLV